MWARFLSGPPEDGGEAIKSATVKEVQSNKNLSNLALDLAYAHTDEWP